MDLRSTHPPYFAIVMGDKKSLGRYVYRINATLKQPQVTALAVRVVRGAKMRCEQDLHNEIAAAFQFPYYYGENWDALDECLTDLEWIPADAYVMVISEASLLLRDEDPVRLTTFVEVLAGTCEYWATEHVEFPSDELHPTAFHVLFHADEGEMEVVRGYLKNRGDQIQIISLPSV